MDIATGVLSGPALAPTPMSTEPKSPDELPMQERFKNALHELDAITVKYGKWYVTTRTFYFIIIIEILAVTYLDYTGHDIITPGILFVCLTLLAYLYARLNGHHPP